MTYDQLIEIQDEEAFLETLEIIDISGYVSIDKKIALPIVTSYSFDRSNDIDLKYESGNKIGVLKFLKDRHISDVESLPDDERICFYIDYTQAQIGDSSHTFKNDFLIVNKKYFNKYKSKYKKSSAIWGSFFHINDQPEIKFDKKKTTTSIIVSDNLKIKNSVYKDNLFLSINEPNPFNRFLKLYHLLELQFDMHTAEKIRILLDQGNKEREISRKLKEYTKEEIKRLQSIINDRCTSIDDLVALMNVVKIYRNKAVKIFYEYGRESNPLKRADFNTILNDVNLFDRSVINGLGGFRYETLITSLCAYWVYRVRSSIAHNKFGEYIVDKDDEEFIVEFIEPLLKEVVKQCFKL